MSFANKTAVVTGAASGIGRATATALAQLGATVAAVDRDGKGPDELLAQHPHVIPYRLDLTDVEAISAFVDQVTVDHGLPDVLVNAAGWDRSEPFLDNTDEFIQDVVNINYLGPVRLTQALLRRVVEAEHHAKVVNLASDAGRVGSAGETVYSGAKGGIIAFTKSTAREMARHGINVNCVCPGPTDTPLFASLGARLRESLIRAIPFRRLATPGEVAAAVLFLASDQASFITGQVLSVSGGLTMAD
jgi:2-hydroxycyclohexanecarboxyl-CoA dehydrogenase